MDFDYSPKVIDLQDRLRAFMEAHVYPNEQRFDDEVGQGDRWEPTHLIEELKAKAKAAGLWNLFLPASERGAGLTNTEYAPLCEIMGRVLWAPEVFNCSAPDTGNMEVLERYGTAEQKRQWLDPLLEGKIRSAFTMTEPDVASSDATNIETSIARDGDRYGTDGDHAEEERRRSVEDERQGLHAAILASAVTRGHVVPQSIWRLPPRTSLCSARSHESQPGSPTPPPMPRPAPRVCRRP